MYIIHTSKSDAEVKLLMDHPSPAEVPKFVAIGIGSIEKRYLKYLDTALNGKNNPLLWFMGQVQLHGDKNGEVELISFNKYADLKKKVFKQYMIDNQSHLNMILPYITGMEFVTGRNDLKPLEDVNDEEVTDVTLKDEVSFNQA